MPYVLSFEKRIEVSDPSVYFNECRFGGDAVVDRLLPSMKGRYSDLWTNQEDWGWFIWFREGGVKLALEVFCDDPARGAFRVHLSSGIRKWLFWDRAIDTPELERLRDLIEKELTAWLGKSPRSERVERLES